VSSLTFKKIRTKLLKTNIDPEAFEDGFFPFELTWFVTLGCNLRCSYCFVPDELDRSDININPIDLLKFCKNKGIFRINVLGGEPFLKADKLIALANNCEKYNVVYRSTSTNGLIYNKSINKALVNLRYKHILQVSLDAACKETYYEVRGNTNFKLIVDNIDKFVNDGLHVMLGMTLTKNNNHEIVEFVKLAEKLGVEMVSFGGMIPLGRGKYKKDYYMNFREKKRCYDEIKNLKTKLDVVLPNDIYGRTCAAGLGQISVVPNGDIYPCNMLLGFPEAKIGNIVEGKLNKFDNEWFIRFSAYKVPKKCDLCELPPICDSACKALTYSVYKKVQPHKPFCEYDKYKV